MLCCIIGVMVVFAADAANTYSIAVSRTHNLENDDLLTSSDRRLPWSWNGLYDFCCQLSHL